MSKAIPSVQSTGAKTAPVLPCLDFAHLHARPGDGSFNSYAEWSRIIETYAEALGEAALQRLHVHMSGIEYGPKGEKNHLLLKESDFDLDALFRALHDFNCQGRILCESPAMEDDALVMLETWQGMARSLESADKPA